EIGQEAALLARGQINRLAFGGSSAGTVSGVKRIGDEHGGLAGAACDPALGGDGGEKQSLARATEHQDFMLGVDGARELVAAVEPLRGGVTERLGALVGRVAAEVRKVRRDLGPDEFRNR